MAFQFPRFLSPRLPQNKRFTFQSRYYEADKERLEKRTIQIQKELEAESAIDSEAIPGKRKPLTSGWAHNHRRHETRKSNGILFVTLLVLTAAVYLIFFVG